MDRVHVHPNPKPPFLSLTLLATTAIPFPGHSRITTPTIHPTVLTRIASSAPAPPKQNVPPSPTPRRRLLLLLRRSLCTAAAASPSPSPSRPPCAILYNKLAVDASGPPSPGARASLDLEDPLVSQLSVPAHLVDPDADATDFLDGTVRAASSDGLLLLDFTDSRHRAPVIGSIRHSWLHELEGPDGLAEPDVSRFVCNPLSGQLFRLPAPDTVTGVAKMGTPFGLLTQSSDGSDGPPDMYAVAQLGRSTCGEFGSRSRVVRRFLSETGEWDEQELVGPSTTPAGGRVMHTDLNHEVVAFGGRLWWVDVSWGVCSVDPFSDQPDYRFVELPQGSVLPDLVGMVGTPTLGRYRRVGVSEGKLRYVEVSNTMNPFVVSSFSLDDKGTSWTLDYKIKATTILPQGFEQLEHQIPRIAFVDPLRANYVFLNYGPRMVYVMDMAKGENLGGFYLPESIGCQTLCHSGFLVPCMLPTWLESSHIPCAGTLASKKASSKRNTLAGMLVRVDRDQKV